MQRGSRSEKKRPRRRSKVKVVIGICIALLPFVVWVVLDLTSSAAVRREVAKLEAKGESLSWDVLAPPEVPDEENAALIYMEAFSLLKETGTDTEVILVLALDHDMPWDKDARQNIARPVGDARLDPEALTEDMAWAAARTRLARNKPALDLIQQATGMEKCRFPVRYRAGIAVRLPHLGPLRSTTRLLVLRTRLKRRDGHVGGAYEDVITGLRVERATRQPLLICYLVGTLVMTYTLDEGLKPLLAEDDAHPDECRRILKELDTLDRKPAFLKALQGERAFGQWAIDTYGVDQAVITSPGPTKPKKGILSFLARPWLKYNQAELLHYWAKALRTAEREPWEALAGAAELESAHERFPRWATWTRHLAPGLQSASEGHAHCEAHQALAKVALALKLHKHRHGSYPPDLSALVPEILSTVPRDPFTGKPLIYRRTENGFLLYSVGPDLADNNGNETPAKWSRRYEGVDIVWKAER